MKTYQAELAVDCRSQLGEGPTWDPETGTVYWLDIEGKKLHHLVPATGKHGILDLSQRLGCVVMREGGGAIAAGERGFVYLDLKTGGIQSIADPEKHLPGTIFNDGKCDSRGRLLVGTASSTNQPEGAFYCLHPNGKVDKLFDGVGCSNGIAWSLDDNIMYYIDSLAFAVAAFDYDIDTGSIGNKRTVIPNTGSDILFDGMTWDEEGNLWIAEWGGWCVSRWNPRSGKKLAVIEVPAKFVTSCVFFGEHMNEMVITTAIDNLTAEELKDQPYAGGLFRVKLDVKGAPSCKFKG